MSTFALPGITVAIQKRPPECMLRGYCGPFELGQAQPSVLSGAGICIHCLSVVSIEAELGKWEAALAGRICDASCECMIAPSQSLTGGAHPQFDQDAASENKHSYEGSTL